MVYISVRDDNAPQSLQHCLFFSEAQNIGALDRMCAQSARNIASVVLCCVVQQTRALLQREAPVAHNNNNNAMQHENDNATV